MIAPEPFFEPRGTPLSEYHRIGSLRPGAFTRRGQLVRCVDCGDARGAAFVRHAFEPAAAARKFFVQPLPNARASVQLARTIRHSPLEGGGGHLPTSRRSGSWD